MPVIPERAFSLLVQKLQRKSEGEGGAGHMEGMGGGGAVGGGGDGAFGCTGGINRAEFSELCDRLVEMGIADVGQPQDALVDVSLYHDAKQRHRSRS